MRLRLGSLVLLFCSSAIAADITFIDLEEICKPPYTSGAILRKDPLFVDDFLALHCLLRKTKPDSVFEIGTCTGEGTLIIKNAVQDSLVYSLELELGTSSYDLQSIGSACYLPYVQVIGDSLSTNYADFYPISAWFIDGAHDYLHVFHETKQALQSNPVLIVWHDADIPEVLEAIQNGLQGSNHKLFQINNTRIAFSIPSEGNNHEL